MTEPVDRRHHHAAEYYGAGDVWPRPAPLIRCAAFGQRGRLVMMVPEAVRYVRDLLDGFGSPWYLCGGWAADSWLGRQTRDHGDVDIAVFHHDHAAIFEHLSGWALVAHDPNVADDTTEQWTGRRLDPPAHVHVPLLGSPLSTSTALTHAEFELEFLLVDRTDQHGRGVLTSPWGLPTATPEVVLFVKGSGDIRPRDEQDFLALAPFLTAEQRGWLRESLAAVRPGHPWLTKLDGDR
jgi:hypothetical protein